MAASALGIAIWAKVFEIDQNLQFSLHSIILHKNLIHAIFNCLVLIILP